MTSRALTLIAALAAAVLLLCLAGPAVLLGGAPAGVCTATTETPPGTAGSNPPAGRWDSEQVANAHTIVTVGAGKGVPARGWVIAVATAMQESGLRNLPGGDRDSLGLFQQRPSQGWGNPDQLLDPAYAAGKFYDKLATIAGWEHLPLTEAAQAVQVNAYPDAYAGWEDDAASLVASLTGKLGRCVPVGPGGWVMPVDGAVVFGFRTAGRPGHDGIDIAAPKGTVIRAAAAGVVTRIRCNASYNGAPYSCDIDGSPDVAGCGWYTEITHAADVITRYCHQLTRPQLAVGQRVAAGQPIGVVGSSGHSSGPHLHLEVHTGAPATEANAVDPVVFLRGVSVVVST